MGYLQYTHKGKLTCEDKDLGERQDLDTNEQRNEIEQTIFISPIPVPHSEKYIQLEAQIMPRSTNHAQIRTKSQYKNSSHTDEKLKYYAAQLNEIGNWHGNVVPRKNEALFSQVIKFCTSFKCPCDHAELAHNTLIQGNISSA